MISVSENRKNGVLPLIIASILWGTTYIFFKYYVEETNFFIPWFFRLLFALISALPLFIILNRKRSIRSQVFYFKQKGVYLLAFLSILSSFSQMLGATLTTSSKNALFINSYVIFIPVLSYFLLKDKINAKHLVGILIGLLGLFFLTSTTNLFNYSGGVFLGDILCFLGGILWAFYIILSKKLMDNTKIHFEPLNLALSSLIISFILILPFIPFQYHTFSQIPTYPLETWLSFAYLGVICTSVGYIFYYRGLEKISATGTSFILLLQIIVAIFLGIFFLSEVLSMFQVFGTVLLLSAIVITNLKRLPRFNFVRKLTIRRIRPRPFKTK